MLYNLSKNNGKFTKNYLNVPFLLKKFFYSFTLFNSFIILLNAHFHAGISTGKVS